MSGRLFEPKETDPRLCLYCNTGQPAHCQWVSDREQGGELQGKTKPKTCLLRTDPSTAPFPESF